jgi:hypothetical protein
VELDVLACARGHPVSGHLDDLVKAKRPVCFGVYGQDETTLLWAARLRREKVPVHAGDVLWRDAAARPRSVPA